MTKLPFAYDHRELLVYQKARQLAAHVFAVSSGFPKEEAFALTDQVRRSSRSIGAQIAEAWAKRRYERHFVSKLTDADAEQNETQHWLEIACDCGYIAREDAETLLNQCQEIGRLLGGMMGKSAAFCKSSSLGEPPPEYFVETTDH